MQVRFKFRRFTAAKWALDNPTLMDGEPGIERDTGNLKIGDGHTQWNNLDYFIPTEAIQTLIDEAIAGSDPGDNTNLLAHINSLTPHPVYDDGPSLELLYENAKV